MSRAKSTKGLYQQPGSPNWYASFTREDGSRFRGSLHTADLKEAERILAKLRTDDFELKSNKFFDKRAKPQDSPPFAEFLGLARTYTKVNTHSYPRFYRYCFNVLDSYFGRMKLGEVDEDAIEKFKEVMQERQNGNYTRAQVVKKVSDSTINRLLIALKIAFNRAVAKKVITEAQIPKIRQIKVSSSPIKKWEEDEVQRIFGVLETIKRERWTDTRWVSPNCFDSRNKGTKYFPYDLLRDLCIMALQTYTRQDELLSIRVRDTVGDQIILTDTKSGDPRPIPLNPKMAEIVDRHKAGKQGDEYLFTWKGNRLHSSNFRKAFQRILKLAGVPRGTWHWFRHTGISLSLLSGQPSLVVQELAGHKSLKTTEIYAHTSKAAKAEAMQRFGVFLGSKVDSHKTVILPMTNAQTENSEPVKELDLQAVS